MQNFAELQGEIIKAIHREGHQCPQQLLSPLIRQQHRAKGVELTIHGVRKTVQEIANSLAKAKGDDSPDSIGSALWYLIDNLEGQAIKGGDKPVTSLLTPVVRPVKTRRSRSQPERAPQQTSVKAKKKRRSRPRKGEKDSPPKTVPKLPNFPLVSKVDPDAQQKAIRRERILISMSIRRAMTLNEIRNAVEQGGFPIHPDRLKNDLTVFLAKGLVVSIGKDKYQLAE